MSTLYSHETRENAAPTAGLYACVFLVSAATLLFEIALTRIFAVTQGYHFAFLAISLALLGFGASGTALAIVPALAGRDIRPVVAGAGLLFAVTSTGGLYLTNVLPFDAYTLLWEPSQLAYLALYYLALAVPFFFAGSIVGVCLARHPSRAGVLYGANLVGAGIGCLLSVVFPLIVGAAGSVVVAGVIALAGAAAMAGRELRRPAWLVPGILGVAAVAAAVVLGVTELRLSPYKAVSQVLRHEGASKAFHRWNAFSLVEVIESGSIHAAPGLSFAYQGRLPRQTALAVDGDNLSPMSAVPPERADFTEYLPTSLVYRLADRPSALLIEPGGGLDVLTALRNGTESVTAVVSNPLVVEAVGERFADHAAGVLGRPGVTVVDEGTRSYLRRTGRALRRHTGEPRRLIQARACGRVRRVGKLPLHSRGVRELLPPPGARRIPVGHSLGPDASERGRQGRLGRRQGPGAPGRRTGRPHGRHTQPADRHADREARPARRRGHRGGARVRGRPPVRPRLSPPA